MLVLGEQIEAITSRRDGTWKITQGTNELSPEQSSELVKLNQKFVYCAYKIDEFKPKDLEILNALQSEFEFKEKSPGQRLQAVFYRLWEVDQEGYKDFQLYYRFKMEKVISHYKSLLP
jgi:hypothetical protein